MQNLNNNDNNNIEDEDEDRGNEDYYDVIVEEQDNNSNNNNKKELFRSKISMILTTKILYYHLRFWILLIVKLCHRHRYRHYTP